MRIVNQPRPPARRETALGLAIVAVNIPPRDL
jgi:hypothetical protein